MNDRGELRQTVGGPRAVVAHIDAPSRPDTDLNTTLREQVTAPFDLNRGPLVRVVAVRRAPGVHILVFVLHHIIADNLSLGLFAREMAEVYRAFSARSVPILAPLPWQYVDFAIAEARWLASPTFCSRLKRYADKIGPTSARLDFGSGQISSTGQAGANHLTSLDAAVVDRLKQVAQRTRRDIVHGAACCGRNSGRALRGWARFRDRSTRGRPHQRWRRRRDRSLCQYRWPEDESSRGRDNG